MQIRFTKRRIGDRFIIVKSMLEVSRIERNEVHMILQNVKP